MNGRGLVCAHARRAAVPGAELRSQVRGGGPGRGEREHPAAGFVLFLLTDEMWVGVVFLCRRVSCSTQPTTARLHPPMKRPARRRPARRPFPVPAAVPPAVELRSVGCVDFWCRRVFRFLLDPQPFAPRSNRLPPRQLASGGQNVAPFAGRRAPCC